MDSGRRSCCSRSPTASQIDRLVLRSICALLSLTKPFMTGFRYPFDCNNAGPSHVTGNCFVLPADCIGLLTKMLPVPPIERKRKPRHACAGAEERGIGLQINSSGSPGA